MDLPFTTLTFRSWSILPIDHKSTETSWHLLQCIQSGVTSVPSSPSCSCPIFTGRWSLDQQQRWHRKHGAKIRDSPSAWSPWLSCSCASLMVQHKVSPLPKDVLECSSMRMIGCKERCWHCNVANPAAGFAGNLAFTHLIVDLWVSLIRYGLRLMNFAFLVWDLVWGILRRGFGLRDKDVGDQWVCRNRESLASCLIGWCNAKKIDSQNSHDVTYGSVQWLIQVE